MGGFSLRSQVRNHSLLWLLLFGTILITRDSSGQMFTAQGGFIATTATAVHAEQSAQSKVVITLKPLEIVEILSREDNDAAIRVKTHKSVHYREPEVKGKFRESGTEVEGWILKPARENIFRQNHARAVFFADIAKLEKWSKAAQRLVICLHGVVIVGSTDTEVNCALGLPTRTTEVKTANGRTQLQEYDCRSPNDTSKCDPASDLQVLTLVNGKVVAIAKHK